MSASITDNRRFSRQDPADLRVNDPRPKPDDTAPAKALAYVRSLFGDHSDVELMLFGSHQ